MTFFLYRMRERYGPPDRFMIDAAHHMAHVEGACTAASWLHAKKHFGFELTPLQADMLKARST